jgi:hypothetical protein
LINRKTCSSSRGRKAHGFKNIMVDCRQCWPNSGM